MSRPILIGFALFLVVFGIMLFVFRKRETTARQTAVPPAASAPSENKPIARKISVKLYFADADSVKLVPEERSIPLQETLQSQATGVLKELIAGPQGKLVPTIPEGTHLRDLFISKDGTAYVDFSPQLSSNHQGGSAGEIMTVYSIVNTLTLNFPQIKQVQILLDAREVDTLKGHLDLSRPLAGSGQGTKLLGAGL